MTGLYSFVLAAFALLMAPGPTNILLAASGATRGFWRSIPLVAAASLGYTVTVMALAALALPLTGHSALTGAVMSIVCGLYLARAAWKLWTDPHPREGETAAGFSRVFLATLTNPKCLVVVFVLLPRRPEGAGLAALVPFIGTLIALAAGAGATWIVAGTLARRGFTSALDDGTVRKASSIVLAGFAAALLTIGLSQGVS